MCIKCNYQTANSVDPDKSTDPGLHILLSEHIFRLYIVLFATLNVKFINNHFPASEEVYYIVVTLNNSLCIYRLYQDRSSQNASPDLDTNI